MDTAESLRRLGTVAFAAEVIEQGVDFDRARGVLDARRWIAMVPSAYVTDATTIASEVFERVRGERFTTEIIRTISIVLSNTLGNRLERRAPVRDGVSGEWFLPLDAGSEIAREAGVPIDDIVGRVGAIVDSTVERIARIAGEICTSLTDVTENWDTIWTFHRRAGSPIVEFERHCCPDCDINDRVEIRVDDFARFARLRDHANIRAMTFPPHACSRAPLLARAHELVTEAGGFATDDAYTYAERMMLAWSKVAAEEAAKAKNPA